MLSSRGEKTFEIIKGAGVDWTFEGLPFAERISHPGSGKYADADFDHDLQPVIQTGDHLLLHFQDFDELVRFPS